MQTRFRHCLTCAYIQDVCSDIFRTTLQGQNEMKFDKTDIVLYTQEQPTKIRIQNVQLDTNVTDPKVSTLPDT